MPHAVASIITRPNGSGQSMGNKSACASPRNSVLLRSLISPMNSTGSLGGGTISSRKSASSTLSTLAAIFRGMPSVRAIRMAQSGRFFGRDPAQERDIAAARIEIGACKFAGMP